MGRSEDYLDSLLDSLNEPKKAKELDLTDITDLDDLVDEVVSAPEAQKKRTPDSEASYLDAFERELEEELGSDSSDFLRDFEEEIGLAPDRDDEAGDIDEVFNGDFDFGSDFDSGVDSNKKTGEANNAAVETGTDSGVIVSSEGDTDDISDILGAAFGDESGENDVATHDDGVVTDIPDDGNTTEEEEDFISDIDDGQADPVNESNALKEAEPEASIASESNDSGDTLSQDEIMDIGDLLDSIDEEGNLADNEGETKPGDAVDADSESNDSPEGGSSGEASKDTSGSEETPEEEGKKRKMPGFLAKIIAILFSTGEEKEEEEKVNPEEEKAEAIDEEPPIDKKQAKKEEKERKKKEKEEAKKKAKEEKEKKAKEKPPKAPKQKKPKVPDNSPKIPLIAILAFILLSASMVVLWFVTEKTVSYSLFVNGAKSSFDHQEYMEAYKKLSGVEEFDEEGLILYNRAKIMAMLEYRINQYEIYVDKDEHINAIDALVRGAVYYNSHQKEASEMGIPSEYDNLGHTITERLETVYGLSMQDAKDLMALRDRKTYTKELYKILEREGLWSYVKR